MNSLDFLSPVDLQEASQFLSSINIQDNDAKTRAKILSCWESIDVSACPGSGKTSMLVANLGWAVDRWQLDGAGICVLSHTNVAKDEIAKRLTKHQSSKLFSWPHFVGTIHEFVNRYVAIPYLRSNDKLIRVIDSDVTYRKCLENLWYVDGYTQTFKRNFHRCNKFKLRNQLTELDWYISADHRFEVSSSENPPEKFREMLRKWSKDSGCYETENSDGFYDFVKRVKQNTSRNGFHSHVDMFAFAQKAISENIDVSHICNRFPLVFVDESQDTNEMQSNLLYQIFDPDQLIVQRFGDSDQQIFDFGDKSHTDHFTLRLRAGLSISETRRCSKPISAVASKLSLSGTAMMAVANDCQILPHIILFDKDSISEVIPTFLDLIETNGVMIEQDSVVKVIGQIGKKPSEEQEKSFPYSIWHYTTSFVKPHKGGIGQPKNIAELVYYCREQFGENGDNYHALNTFFMGLARLVPGLGVHQTSRFPFREVRKTLDNDEQFNFNSVKLFESFLSVFKDITLSHPTPLEIKSQLEKILTENGVKYSREYMEFSTTISRTDTLFVMPLPGSDQTIHVEIDTIAGVKGETHTATLVLETFSRKHCIKEAIKAAFQPKRNETQKKYMKHLFVAMTRPKDFLCLALPQDGYDQLAKEPQIKNWLDDHFATPLTLGH